MLVELTELWLVGGSVFVVLIALSGAIWAALVGRWWDVARLQKSLYALSALIPWSKSFEISRVIPIEKPSCTPYFQS